MLEAIRQQHICMAAGFLAHFTIVVENGNGFQKAVYLNRISRVCQFVLLLNSKKLFCVGKTKICLQQNENV